jgi:hypothetical protein
MSARDEGGPAFPQKKTPYDERDHAGMTLRDYFAAKAMQGLLACPIQPQSGPEMYARDAYKISDEMLKARTT